MTLKAGLRSHRAWEDRPTADWAPPEPDVCVVELYDRPWLRWKCVCSFEIDLPSSERRYPPTPPDLHNLLGRTYEDVKNMFQEHPIGYVCLHASPEWVEVLPGSSPKIAYGACLHVHFHEGVAIAAYGKPGGPHDALPESTD